MILLDLVVAMEIVEQRPWHYQQVRQGFGVGQGGRQGKFEQTSAVAVCYLHVGWNRPLAGRHHSPTM